MDELRASRSKISSFLIGLGRAVDISGTARLPNYYSYFYFSDLPESEDADIDALAKDWQIVGLDIRNACKEFAYREGVKSPEELQLLLPLGAK